MFAAKVGESVPELKEKALKVAFVETITMAFVADGPVCPPSLAAKAMVLAVVFVAEFVFI